jgi:16S rRNA (adenine1518-N6/adenine1519-N6)-dimethyltransferase
MAAAPGTSDYSALSVWLQAQTQVTMVRKLSPAVFWPRPRVDSAIVRIDPDPDTASRIADREFLHTFLRDIFTQRRKRLRGVLASLFHKEFDKQRIDQLFNEAAIPVDVRAEQLTPAQLVELSNAFHRAATTSPPEVTSEN